MPVIGGPVASERFQILRKLGEGGMGVVYEAHDARLDVRVALKTLRTANAELLYQFKNEFRSLADLHHPNLINLYELFAEEGTWFFTMELLEGEDFDRFVRASEAGGRAEAAPTPTPRAPVTPAAERATLLSWGGFLGAPSAARSWNGLYDEARLRRSLAQLAAGLFALHTAGKIHRDVKPSNLLVTPEGRVVVMDFGLAADAALMEEWAAMENIAGTPAYMAPEQAQPGAVGTAADWYSVGAILYEILSGGRLPHEADAAPLLLALKGEPPPPLASLDLSVPPPPDLAQLCQELLAPDPADRPSGEAILERLGAQAPARVRERDEMFVGRERELDALRAAYRDSRRAAVSVFVEGSSGLGKTALVDRVLAEVRAAGGLVLRGRCHAEESVPYKGFDGIVDALSRALVTMGKDACTELLPDSAPLAARIFPVLLRVPRLEAPPREPEISAVELRSRAFAALGAIFAAVARARPLALFIDDVQWADADSLLLLRDLLHPDSAPPMLVIASVRTESTDAARVAESARLSPRVIPIEPLGSADTRALIDALAPDEDEERKLEIEREAGGHPLFIAELARSRRAHGARLDDALWERALGLDADARRVLELVAVAGAPTDVSTLAAATGFDPARCAVLASLLRSERFVKQLPTADGAVVIEPYHDRVRETVASRLAGPRLAAISGALARALLGAGVGETAPELVVRHLLAAGDTVRAVELAEAAAQRAEAALAFDRAAEFLRTALGAAEGDQHGRLNIKLAEALASAGRGAAAADAFLAAGARGDGVDVLDCRRRAAEQLLASGHVDRGLSELGEVLDSLGEPNPITPQQALESLRAARAELDRWPLPAEFRSERDIDRDALRRLDTCQATSLGLILVDNVRGAAFQARALRLALAAREPRRLLRALLLEGIYRAQEGAEGRRFALGALDAARRVAEGHGDPWMEGYLVLARAWIAYYEGRFKRSVELFTDADERFRELPGVTWERNAIRIHRLRATDYQGAWSELRPLYDEYLRDAQRRDDRYALASIVRWFNVLWLARDRPDLAGRDIDSSPWTPPEEGRYHLQHFLELRARVELALYRGEGARQGAWAYAGLDAAERSLLFRIQIARAIGDWLRGRIAACEGDADRVEAMVRRLADEDINYASIWAGLLAGSARLLRGDRAAAVQVLGAIADYADGNHFPLCAAIARLRAAQIEGDDGAVARALAWMRGQDIHDPLAMAEVFAPGYGASGTRT